MGLHQRARIEVRLSLCVHFHSAALGPVLICPGSNFSKLQM